MRKTTALLALIVTLCPLAGASACDEMGELRRAMQQAKADTAAYQRQALDRAVAEAQVVKDVMEQYLSLVYFPGMWQLRDETIFLTIGDGDAFQAVSARQPFLRGPAGLVIDLKPAQRAAQFAALKADYRAALERAGNAQRSLGEQRQAVWALTEWGAESIVSSDGKDYVQVITQAEKSRILAPAPSAPADPHE